MRRRVYGVQRVCAAWAFPRASYYAANPAAPAPAGSGKRGPKTALGDVALLALIRADLAQSPFRGEGHRKVFGRLRYVGGHQVRRNRILRLMRKNRLLSPHRTTPAPAKAHDGRITTDAPNVRWATDGAKVWTVDDGWLWLFTTIEHWNAECLGHHVCPYARPFAVGPPRPEVAVLIDAATGDCHALDPPDFPPGLPYPQPRDEPIRFRAEVMEPGESFDQTGFELPPPPQVAPVDAEQGELFGDDYSQPDSADREPVFWSDGGDQSASENDFVQADAANCAE